MDTSRIGPGEWLAALGGLVLLIALFFVDWYSWEPSGDIAPLEISSSLLAQVDPNQVQIPVPDVSVDLGAWDEQGFLGTIANFVMLAAAVWAIVAVGLKSGEADADMGVDPGRLTFGLGIAATVLVVLRMIFTPGDDLVDTSLKFGIFLALIGAVLIAIGGAMSREAAPARPRPRPTGGGAPPPPPPPPAGEPPPPPPPSRGA
jgi:hypothetical protein